MSTGNNISKRNQNIFYFYQVVWGTVGLLYYLKSLFAIIEKQNDYTPNYLLSVSLAVFFHLTCWSIILLSGLLRKRGVAKYIGLLGWSLLFVAYILSIVLLKTASYYALHMSILSFISIVLIASLFKEQFLGKKAEPGGRVRR